MAAEFMGAWCAECEVKVYRSIRPLDAAVDKISPELFRPVAGGDPPPLDGPALCPVCSGELKFGFEKPLTAVPQVPNEPAFDQYEPAGEHREGGLDVMDAVKVLFEAGPDEEVKSISQSPKGYYYTVVTTKRILRIYA